MFWTDAVKKLRIAGLDSGTYLAGGTLFVLMIALIIAIAL
jgi:hypothetical protein